VLKVSVQETGLSAPYPGLWVFISSSSALLHQKFTVLPPCICVSAKNLL